MSGDPDDTPADLRMRELLEELGHDEPATGRALTERVVHTARWQVKVRRAVSGVGTVVGGLAQGAAVLLGLRRRRREADG